MLNNIKMGNIFKSCASEPPVLDVDVVLDIAVKEQAPAADGQ